MCMCVCVHMKKRAAQSTEIVSGKYSLQEATRSAQAFKRPQEFTSVCYS